MMEKHGEDYVKMAKDYQNYYQDTPAQIKKKISLFKQMKFQYKKYLDEKKAGVNFLAKLDHEARLWDYFQQKKYKYPTEFWIQQQRKKNKKLSNEEKFN